MTNNIKIRVGKVHPNSPHKHISRSATHDERFPCTITCQVCKSSFRAYSIGIIVHVNKYSYCIVCGSNRISVAIDIEQDYLECLAKTYNMSPEAIEQIYDMWVPQEEHSFAKHVAKTKKLLAAMRKLESLEAK